MSTFSLGHFRFCPPDLLLFGAVQCTLQTCGSAFTCTLLLKFTCSAKFRMTQSESMWRRSIKKKRTELNSLIKTIYWCKQRPFVFCSNPIKKNTPHAVDVIKLVYIQITSQRHIVRKSLCLVDENKYCRCNTPKMAIWRWRKKKSHKFH